MNVEFLNAKDGNLTCKVNSVFMHSAYSPIKESERYTQNINSPFIPELIFIIEPCLSYCANFLREKYPKTKLVVIRLLKGFETKDSLFDYSFYLSDFISSENLFNKIFNVFGENILSFSLIFQWDSSAKIFTNEIVSLFQSYKRMIEKCHSILRTRSFFEKRWLLNSVKNTQNIKNVYIFKKKGNCPVFICASGPSLKESIDFIKANKPFIIAVSSAIKPLIQNNIIPDICISTDGGFWANKHLDAMMGYQIPLALSIEGSCPSKILKNSPILPLIYSDGGESQIFRKSQINGFEALRCGTVSGTALDLAEKITTGDIYFSGLDLSVAKGFQHTQGNNLEIKDQIFDNKLRTKEHRISLQSLSNQRDSLKIYEDWFKSYSKQEKNRKIFRIITNPKNKLGSIKDISTNEILNTSFSGEKPVFETVTKNNNQSDLLSFIKKESQSESWMLNIFTADFLNYTHSNDENFKEAIMDKIKIQNKMLLENLCRLFTKK